MECINCGNKSFYECDNITSAGGYGPDLLPGTGVFSHAKYTLKICESCKFVHWFIKDEDMEKIEKSSKFTLTRYE